MISYILYKQYYLSTYWSIHFLVCSLGQVRNESVESLNEEFCQYRMMNEVKVAMRKSRIEWWSQCRNDKVKDAMMMSSMNNEVRDASIKTRTQWWIWIVRFFIHVQVLSARRILWHESEVWAGRGGGPVPSCGGDMWRAVIGRADWPGVHLHPLAETDG